MRNSYQLSDDSVGAGLDMEDRLRQIVRLRSQRGRVITAADEDKLLEDAVTRFGVSLDRARGVLHSEIRNGQIALESDLEDTVSQLVKSLAGSGKKLSRRDFEAAVSFYAARRKIPLESSRQAVKRLMEEEGIAPKRAGFMQSKRWYRRIRS